jgi:hypothetical protein
MGWGEERMEKMERRRLRHIRGEGLFTRPARLGTAYDGRRIEDRIEELKTESPSRTGTPPPYTPRRGPKESETPHRRRPSGK